MFRNAIKAKYTVVFPETAPQKQEASIQELLLVEAQYPKEPRLQPQRVGNSRQPLGAAAL